MAYLGKYVRQLLAKNEAVTLPGFGSLQVREGKVTPGHEGTLEPPGMIIVFDPAHPLDDGKLADAYAAGEQIDREEARQQVLELVDAIKFKLDKGETYALDLVGKFSRDQDNRVRFSKDPNWVIDPDMFGLSTLELLELEEPVGQSAQAEATAQEAGAQEPGTSSGKAEEEPVSPEKVPTETAPRKRTVRRAPVNKWRIIWIVVGSLIVVLVLLLLIPGNQEMKFGRDGVVFEDIETGTMEEEIRDEQSGGDIPGEQKEGVTGGPDETAPVEQQPEGAEDNYYIIAGSFQGLQNATELQDELKAKGFPARIIITENRMYRVAVTSYKTREAAIDDLERVRSRTGLPGCWVLTR